MTRFKGPVARAKFDGLAWNDGLTGCPILADCLGYLECRVVQRLPPGNHTLFLAEVVQAGFNTEGDPLSTLDYDGCYLGKS